MLLNLNNADPENRRLARYDYAKMNLTAAITFEQVEQEVKQYQEELGKLIDDYEYEARRVEKLTMLVSSTDKKFENFLGDNYDKSQIL